MYLRIIHANLFSVNNQSSLDSNCLRLDNNIRLTLAFFFLMVNHTKFIFPTARSTRSLFHAYILTSFPSVNSRSSSNASLSSLRYYHWSQSGYYEFVVLFISQLASHPAFCVTCNHQAVTCPLIRLVPTLTITSAQKLLSSLSSNHKLSFSSTPDSQEYLLDFHEGWKVFEVGRPWARIICVRTFSKSVNECSI
jgi:hypothetical protein